MRRDLLSWHKAGTVVSDQLPEGFINGRDHTPVEQVLGEVGPCDDRIGKCGFQILIGDRTAVFCQKTAHLAVPVYSGVRESAQPVREFPVLPIDEKADDMNIFTSVLGGQLYAGDHFRDKRVRILRAERPGSLNSFFDAVDGIVIGQRYCSQSFLRGIADQLRGRQGPVRPRGMGM